MVKTSCSPTGFVLLLAHISLAAPIGEGDQCSAVANGSMNVARDRVLLQHKERHGGGIVTETAQDSNIYKAESGACRDKDGKYGKLIEARPAPEMVCKARCDSLGFRCDAYDYNAVAQWCGVWGTTLTDSDVGNGFTSWNGGSPNPVDHGSPGAGSNNICYLVQWSPWKFTGCNWQCYLDRYPVLDELCQGSLDCAKNHYEVEGKAKGRDCTCLPSNFEKYCKYCNWKCYLDNYPGLQRFFGANNVAGAAEHYKQFGYKEGRNCACTTTTTTTTVAKIPYGDTIVSASVYDSDHLYKRYVDGETGDFDMAGSPACPKVQPATYTWTNFPIGAWIKISFPKAYSVAGVGLMGVSTKPGTCQNQPQSCLDEYLDPSQHLTIYMVYDNLIKVCRNDVDAAGGEWVRVPCLRTIVGDSIKIRKWIRSTGQSLALCEVEVYLAP